MKASLNWISQFLATPLDPHDTAARLAMLGTPVDSIEAIHHDLTELVVARVVAVASHPNADRLRICSVDDGSGTLAQVVCGAPNVMAGGAYPFARIGTTLPGGIKIEKRKIRGEQSQGMLCSGRELGLTDDHDGLLTLDTAIVPGTPLLEALPVADYRLEVDVTPNRSDLNCHKGLARELSASLGIPFRLPPLPEGVGAVDLTLTRNLSRVDGSVEVKIDPASACERFVGAVIRGVKIGPSPLWLRTRLAAAGMRSINNVVDAANYVMLELNQPLHTYDLAKLRGGKITARLAAAGEHLITLDGTDRVLGPETTVIADAEGPVGIAGVMGGMATEIGLETTDLFLEAAWFQPTRIRATRRKLGISTEASYRFERGVDIQAVPEAVRRAVQLILTVAGGQLQGAAADLWPEPSHPARIFLRYSRVTQVLGVELPLHAVEQALVACGAQVLSKPMDERLAVEVPGWRPDLTSEIDLIEEIARLYGYNNFPSPLRPFRIGAQLENQGEIQAASLKRELVAWGLYENISVPLEPESSGGRVRLLNPLSRDHSCLRDSLLPGLIRAAQENWGHQIRDIRLFELGTVFEPGPVSNPRPMERTKLAVVLSGSRYPEHWTASATVANFDLWDIKGILEWLAPMAYPGSMIQVAGDGWIVLDPDGGQIGRAGLLSCDAPPWAAVLLGLELEVLPVVKTAEPMKPIPLYPGVERDLALLVPQGVAAERIRGQIVSAHELVESVRIVDEFRGGNLPDGRRSVGYRIIFRSPSQTLRDGEVTAILKDILHSLERECDVTLRTA